MKLLILFIINIFIFILTYYEINYLSISLLFLLRKLCIQYFNPLFGLRLLLILSKFLIYQANFII